MNYKCNNKHCNQPFYADRNATMCPRCGSKNIVNLGNSSKNKRNILEDIISQATEKLKRKFS